MSRPSGKSLKQARLERNQPVERVPLATFVVRKVLNWPRLARIALIAFFAFALTAAVFPIVDYMYLKYLFDEDTRVLPSIVSIVVGFVMYLVGWYFLVGTRGEKRPERLGVLIYLIVGVLLVLFVFILIVDGYSTATLPTF